MRITTNMTAASPAMGTMPQPGIGAAVGDHFMRWGIDLSVIPAMVADKVRGLWAHQSPGAVAAERVEEPAPESTPAQPPSTPPAEQLPSIVEGGYVFAIAPRIEKHLPQKLHHPALWITETAFNTLLFFPGIAWALGLPMSRMWFGGLCSFAACLGTARVTEYWRDRPAHYTLIGRNAIYTIVNATVAPTAANLEKMGVLMPPLTYAVQAAATLLLAGGLFLIVKKNPDKEGALLQAERHEREEPVEGNFITRPIKKAGRWFKKVFQEKQYLAPVQTAIFMGDFLLFTALASFGIAHLVQNVMPGAEQVPISIPWADSSAYWKVPIVGAAMSLWLYGTGAIPKAWRALPPTSDR